MKVVKVGVAELSSSRQSIRLTINDGRKGDKQNASLTYYIHVEALEKVLKGKKKSATIIKLEEQEGE